jgi:hypothetical protein
MRIIETWRDAVDDQLRNPIPGWHYGLDPEAAGLAVRSMERVHHRLGDALRLELEDPRGIGPELHLQWFIATRVGAWALWIACPPDQAAAHEAELAAVTWFDEATSADTLAELRA